MTILADGNVGIGTGAPTVALQVAGEALVNKLSVNPNLSNPATDTVGVIISPAITRNASANSVTGLNSGMSLTQSGAQTGSVVGILGNASVNGSGYTQPSMIGVQGQAIAAATLSSTVAKSVGVEGNVSALLSATITEAISLLGKSNTETAGGILGTSYGLYLESQTAAATNWQLYSAGTAPSRFSGSLGIGVDPARPLHVNGPMRITASTVPASPALGDIYVDSGDSKLKYHNGTGWVDAGGTAGSSNIDGLTDGKTTGGTDSVYLGENAGFTASAGANFNVAVGVSALYYNTSGDDNTAIGMYALEGNTTGVDSTAIGSNALGNATGNTNIAIGKAAMTNAGSSNTNVAIGNNTLLGLDNGIHNVAIGHGVSPVFGAKSRNVIVGQAAGSAMTTSNNNILIGYQAGDNITTGGTNLIVGYNINAPSATASNQMSIGNLIFGTGLDGTGTTVSTGNVGIGTSAPARRLHVEGPMRLTASTVPSSPALGDIYVDSGDSKLKYHNGTGWVDAGGTAGAVTSVGATAPIVSSGGATPSISVNLGDGLTTASSSLTVNLGLGLEFNSGVIQVKSGPGTIVDGWGVSANFGAAAGQVMAADAVPNCDPDEKLQMSAGPTFLWSCVADLGITSESDPQVGTLTNTKWCTSDGSQVICNSDLPTALTNFTESVNSSAPNTSIPVVQLLATNAATHIDLALAPKGDGALAAQVSDNTTTGGNKRGPKSVDWQRGRTDAAQVASGNFTVIAGGFRNTASGHFSAVGGGNFNTVSGGTSVISGGNQNTVSGNFSTIGGGQLNSASGNNAVVPGGESNAAIGLYSFAANNNTTADSYAQTTFGQYNMPKGSENAATWASADPLFVVGNGTGSGASRSTALMVLKNGNVGVGLVAPARRLHVEGPMRITASTVPASPALGDMYVDSGDSKLKYHNGTGWVDAGGTAGGVTSVGATAPIVSSGGATPDISLNLGNGLTTVTNSLALNLGNGLEFNSGAVRAKAGTGISVDGNGINVLIGDAAGEVMGADSVPECDPDEKLQMSAGPTFAWSCVADLGITTESDPKVGTLTNTKWCTSDGSQVICNTDAPIAGTGDVVNGGNTVTSTMVVGTNSNHALGFETNGTTKMTVLADGKVGIGTVTPSQQFHVYTAGAIGTSLRAESQSGGVRIQIMGDTTSGIDFMNPASSSRWFIGRAGNDLRIVDTANGPTPMTFQAATGRVGIGTTSPDHALDIHRASGEARVRTVREGGSGTNEFSGYTAQFYKDTGDGAPYVFLQSSRGTASSPVATGLGDILGSVDFYGRGATDFKQGGQIIVSATETYTDATSAANMRFFTTNSGSSASTEKMRIRHDGNVGIGETAPARKLHVAGPMRITASTVPASPALGDIYVDSGDSKLKYHNGTGWVDAGGSGGGGTVTAVSASGVLASSGGNTPDISLNIGNGLTTVSSSLTMNLGNGLEFNSGAVRAKAGDSIVVDGDGINVLTGTVAGAVITADGVPHCDPDEKLEMAAGPAYVWTCVPDLGITSETDPKVGTLTNTKWCTSDGSQVICNTDAPAGDVTIGGNTVLATMVVGTNSNHNLAFETNSATRMTILSGGNVGIGTETPGFPLDVYSNGNATMRLAATTGASQAATIRIVGTNTAGSTSQESYLTSYQPSGGGLTDAALDIRVRKNGDTVGSPSTIMTLLGSGRVGIGTTTPYDKLSLQGSDEEVRLRIMNVNSTTPRYPGISVVNVMGSGNHNGAPSFSGIQTRGTAGVTAPVELGDHLFQLTGSGVYNAGWDSRPNAQIAMTATETHSGSAGGASLSFHTTANGTTSLTKRMLIDHNGNVGVGLDAPGAKLEVSGDIRASGQISSGSSTITGGGSNTIDWDTGNAISTDYNCASSLVMDSLRDGGTYTLVITNTGTTQCNFDTTTTGTGAGTVAYRFKPTNAPRTGTSHTIYSLMRVGNVVYVSWQSGF